LLHLKRGHRNGIKISPRWPFSTVAVSETAFSKLEAAQVALGKNIQLVLIRSFESPEPILRGIRTFGRRAGQLLFGFLYPRRLHERPQIFSPNGHDRDGNHIDIGIEIDEEWLRLLPFGVFSSLEQVRRAEEKNAHTLSKVRSALVGAGFTIHSNPVEALQIHCDLSV